MILIIMESDGDTNCNWCTWYNHQNIGTGTGGLGNKKTFRDHPNYSIIEIGQNTKKSPGDLIWFLCLMAYQPLQKNSSGTI